MKPTEVYEKLEKVLAGMGTDARVEPDRVVTDRGEVPIRVLEQTSPSGERRGMLYISVGDRPKARFPEPKAGFDWDRVAQAILDRAAKIEESAPPKVEDLEIHGNRVDIRLSNLSLDDAKKLLDILS